jgi:hypothetical protein
MVTTQHLLPADIVEPARFGNLNPGYLEFPTFFGWSYLFWWPGAGALDPALQSLDFGLRATFAAGEVITFRPEIQRPSIYCHWTARCSFL